MSTPLQFQGIHLKNFLSFGNNLTEIDLTYFGSTLIVGENLDANSNNGAGKTTIINAICYALYNKPFDNISLQRLINSTNNTKNTLMEVRLFIKKGEDDYEIYRCRGETYNIQIICNGEDVTLDSVTANDKFVEEIVGMTYDLFTKIVIFSGASTPFLLLPVSQQRQQIEELFNITLLTEKAVTLKEKIKQTESDVNVQEAIIKQQEGAIKLWQKQVQEANDRISRWEFDRTRQIKSLRAAQNSESVDLELEKELHDLVGELKPKLLSVETDLKLAQQRRESSERAIIKFNSELDHLVKAKCPYCLQKFEDADAKIHEINVDLNNEVQLRDGFREVCFKLGEQLGDLTDQINQAKTLMVFPSYAAAVQAKTSAETAQAKIDELDAAANPHIEALESLKRHAVEDISYDDLNALKKELDHQQFLLKLLTDKNSFIRRRIINQTIPFLNGRLNSYTRELGLQHIVKFDDDMSCTVSEYGRELDFGNLSSGEKKRVNLSLSLAFRDVLHHLHSKVNCLFIDEIDASLDNSGVEAVFKMLKQKTRDDGLGMWIISHRPEAVGRFDRSLTVRKENGFSQIVD